MRVALKKTGVSDADELGVTQLLDIVSADITHSCPQTTDKLIYDF